MEIADVISIISNVGFPIFIVVYLLYLQNKNDERYDTNIKELNSYITENTKILQHLVDKLEQEEN